MGTRGSVSNFTLSWSKTTVPGHLGLSRGWGKGRNRDAQKERQREKGKEKGEERETQRDREGREREGGRRDEWKWDGWGAKKIKAILFITKFQNDIIFCCIPFVESKSHIRGDSNTQKYILMGRNIWDLRGCLPHQHPLSCIFSGGWTPDVMGGGRAFSEGTGYAKFMQFWI